MRTQAIALGVLWACTAWSHTGRAQSQPVAARATPTVVLIMESGGGVRAGRELREALNRAPNTRVLSLADATKQHVQAAAVLAVATDLSRTVSVVYWDLWGGSDALSAPMPELADQVAATELALASALLDRHRADLTAHPLDARHSDISAEVGRSSRAFYALLDRVALLTPRTNVALRLEDF